jgi:hypothetical protein
MVGFGALVGGVGLPATCLVTGLGFVALVLWALVRLRGAQPVAEPGRSERGGAPGQVRSAARGVGEGEGVPTVQGRRPEGDRAR